YGNLGLSSDGGASYWLPRTVGRRKAMEMFLLPEVFNAENAKTHGLVNWVVPKEQLTEESERILQRLANGPSAAYKEVKCLVRSTWDNSLAEQLEEEAHSFARCTCTEDFGRGVTAFLAKQRPEFVGC
ncbi:MAG: enoyl-CoA hydratase, partial [Chlamydiia bacterium]|nr:enoyl-CoA hydratase [Chlamydiia bacterium]